MSLLNGIYHRKKLLLPSLVYGILEILTHNRTVGGNLNDIHTVDLPELLLLRESRTGHACLFPIFIEEVLEGNVCQSFALTLYLHMLLCLNRLVQSVGITAARHNTAGKFVYNQNLIVLHHVILVPEHQIVCTQSQNYIVLNLQILRVRQILNVEILLHTLHAVIGEINNLVLLIDDKLAGLHDFLAHNGIHLGKFPAGLAPLHSLSQSIADLIELRGLSALS